MRGHIQAILNSSNGCFLAVNNDRKSAFATDQNCWFRDIIWHCMSVTMHRRSSPVLLIIVWFAGRKRIVVTSLVEYEHLFFFLSLEQSTSERCDLTRRLQMMSDVDINLRQGTTSRVCVSISFWIFVGNECSSRPSDEERSSWVRQRKQLRLSMKTHDVHTENVSGQEKKKGQMVMLLQHKWGWQVVCLIAHKNKKYSR